jgi:hypothetical protein
MAFILLNDRFGVQYSFEVSNLLDGNVAFLQTIGDTQGNTFAAAPGKVGWPVQAEGIKTGYQFSVLGFAPVATPTDVLEIKGSASKTIRVRRISITGGATAAGNMPVQLIRRSTASTGGGSALTALTAFKPDTAYATATVTVSTFGTANPTAGTAAGGIAAAGRVCLSALGTGLGVSPLVFDFDINAAVLRGTSEFFYLNMNGAALPAGSAFDITVVLQEDAS